jgi:hypothetical protein
MKKLAALGLLILGVTALRAQTQQAQPPRETTQLSSVRIRILARVGGRSVSDREVELESYFADPKRYQPGVRSSLNAEMQNALLDRLLTEIMIEEENRVVGAEKLSPSESEELLSGLRSGFGRNWDSFVKEWELSELEIKQRLGRKLLVDKALASRLRGAPPSATEGDQSEQALQEWIRQLRARYRVETFRYDP